MNMYTYICIHYCIMHLNSYIHMNANTYTHTSYECKYIHTYNQERGWDSIGVMDSDWQDTGPDACRARREIYDACHGRIFTFDGEAFLVEDTTNFMLLGSQGEHTDYCKATDNVALTQVDAGFQDKRDLLTENFCLFFSQ